MDLFTRLAVLFTLLLGIAGAFGAGISTAKVTAVITVKNVFYNDMMYVEPGSPEDQSRQEEIDREPDVYTVKAGDKVDNGRITIVSVNEQQLKFSTSWEYVTSGGDPARTFTVKKGESITIYEYGLCDATSYYVIAYLPD